MILAPPVLMAALRRLEPERAHHLALTALRWGLAGRQAGPDDPILATAAFGRQLANPIGLAAGFDKNAAALAPLGRLGFGFVEAGTVTPRPQNGNPRPRLFRLEEDRAIINRMGFNNQGLEVFLANLRRAARAGLVLGANFGINKEGAEPERDYPAMASALAPHADYLAINVSSPNTPGLRDLQSGERLAGILRHIASPKPVFIKIAPDLTEDGLEAVVAAALAHDAAGLIIANTTLARPATLKNPLKRESGGLSGAPLFAPSTAMLARAARLAGGRLALIGAGGVFTPEDALAKLLAGAALVQIYTGFVYQGPAMLARLKPGLARLLRERGFSSVAEAVGAGL
ncbi:quinone-dependent dihydroorotate dehydrogenase [Acidocella sp.]|uniref:quinone-dependent dihydroorotate dehydrogenase n=1 Tax=Acidocella sp. TaxID=50710 RepID=UPI002635F611|nr:quinone-dependent dihydroorotate dehydrogenase [Acidocella sp.]